VVSDPIPDGYCPLEKIRGSSHGSVYFAERQSDGQSVVVKTFSASSFDVERAQREWSALEAFDHPSIPRPLDFVHSGNSVSLVLSYAAGCTLRQWVFNGRPNLEASISVAVQICEALAHVHERRFVHRDVTPDNVIVDPETQRTTLIDLGLTLPFGTRAMQEIAPSRESELTQPLEFIAPEQTGRMNRGWDARSDLYSFGAVLYFMLTGRAPFEYRDALELIHAHIARPPRDPRELRSELPRCVSSLVLRLLRKQPEERYASAQLLLEDLRHLAEQLQTHGGLPDDLSLRGMRASTSRLTFPAELSGRELELRLIGTLFDRAASGQSGSLLVSGEPGVGKTALIHAIGSRVGERRGFFAAGKFDPYGSRPYSAWIEVFESLTQQLLLLQDAQLEALRDRLNASLGNVAQALVDVVPDLGFVLGNVPAVPHLGPRETQERLRLALERAIRALATREHPLLILLDDLHVADAGSLLLAESVLCARPTPEALLLIGTYSAPEVGPTHPIANWQRRLVEREAEPAELELNSLDLDATVQLLAQTLVCTPECARQLAIQVERKTGNRPFLIRELLENLRADGLLRFDGERWQWDTDQIEAARIPEGAIALLLARIERLGPEAATMLRHVACASDPFDLDLLGALGCGEPTQLEGTLFELAEAGLIVPVRSGFRVAHDRIRAATRESMGTREREQLHLEIGRFLLENTPEDRLEERASLIADQLAQAPEQLEEPLRLRLLRVYLLAGQHALRSGTAQAAASYLQLGCEHLVEADRVRDPELAFTLEMEAADALFHCGEYADCLARIERIEQLDLELLDWARVESTRILVLALTRPPEDAMRRVVQAFRRIGFRWTFPMSWFRFRMELALSRRALDRARFGLDWRPSEHPPAEHIARLILSAASGGVASRSDSRLGSVICARAGLANSRYGFITSPGYCLASCAFTEITDGQDPKRAEKLAESAKIWGGRHCDPKLEVRQEFLLQALVYPWLRPRRKELHALTHVAERSRELGDSEFAFYAELNQNIYLALGGETVPTVCERLWALADGVRRRGQNYPEAAHCHQLYRSLLLDPQGAANLESCVRELERSVARIPPSGAVYYRTLCMQVLCIHGREDLAFEQSERVFGDLFRVVPYLHVADHVLYRGLAAAELIRRARGPDRRTYKRALRQSLRLLRRWSGWGPDFQHMLGLLEAEGRALRNDVRAASRRYDDAARRAQEQGFVHHAALAFERKSQLLGSHRRNSEAAIAMREASTLYQRWGCQAKLTT